MPNILNDPAKWGDPIYWNPSTLRYEVLIDNPDGADPFSITSVVASAGDTIEFHYEVDAFVFDGIHTVEMAVRDVTDNVVVWSDPLSIIPASGDASVACTEGHIYKVSAERTEGFGTVVYDFEAIITPTPDPIPPEPDKVYRIGNYLRAYYGADTPLEVWVRGEDGPFDLSGDTITVEATWPWNGTLSIPATGDANGKVSFTITQAMLWRTWGDDYGINTARFRGQRSLLRVVSAQRGVLALAHLEVA